MRFRISGAHKDTGDEVQMTIEAHDQRVAEKWASKNGIVWTNITPQLPPAPSPSNPTQLAAGKPYAPERDGVIWLIGAIAVLLSLMVSDRQIGFFDANALASTLGAAFAYLLVVFVFGFIGAKIGGRQPKGARMGFTIGAFVFLAVLALSEYRIRQERAKDLSVSAQQIASQVRSAVGSPTAPLKTSQTPVVSGLSAREAAAVKVLLAEVQDIYSDAKKIGDDFQQEVAQIVGDGILQPSRLDTGPKISLAKSKLTQFAQLVEKRQKNCDAIFGDMPRRLNALPIDAAMKESAVRGYQKNMGPSAQCIRQLTAANREFVAEAQRLADFMRSRLGRFRVTAGKVYFDEDADVARYNAIYGRIQQAVAKEQELTQQMQQMAQQGADALEQIFKR